MSPEGKGTWTPRAVQRRAGRRLAAGHRRRPEAGGRVAAQLSHVGRVSHESFHDGALPVSASAVPFRNRTTVRGEDGRPTRVTWPARPRGRWSSTMTPPAPLMNPTTLSPCTASIVGATVARHGTLVAGVIAASATIGGAEGSGEGIAGVAFNSTIHSMKMTGFDLANQTQAFHQAAIYRGEHADALVYNASFNVLNAFAPVADVTALCGAINSLVLSGTTARAIVVNSAGKQ